MPTPTRLACRGSFGALLLGLVLSAQLAQRENEYFGTSTGSVINMRCANLSCRTGLQRTGNLSTCTQQPFRANHRLSAKHNSFPQTYVYPAKNSVYLDRMM